MEALRGMRMEAWPEACETPLPHLLCLRMYSILGANGRLPIAVLGSVHSCMLGPCPVGMG